MIPYVKDLIDVNQTSLAEENQNDLSDILQVHMYLRNFVFKATF